MMFRTLLREQTVKQLTELGRWHRVFNARQPVTTRDDLPYVKIWTPDDGGDGIGIRGMPYHGRPTVSLVIQVVIEGTEDEANARLIDDMCEAITHHLVEDANWIRLFNQISAINTTIESNTEGEARTVIGTMTYDVEYEDIYVTRILDDLDRLDITVPIPGQPPTDDGSAGNTIRVPIQFRPPSIGQHGDQAS
jgi:hypothetical protein